MVRSYLMIGLFDLGNVISLTGFKSHVLHNLEERAVIIQLCKLKLQALKNTPICLLSYQDALLQRTALPLGVCRGCRGNKNSAYFHMVNILQLIQYFQTALALLFRNTTGIKTYTQK